MSFDFIKKVCFMEHQGNRKVEKTSQKSKQQVTNDSIQTQNKQ